MDRRTEQTFFQRRNADGQQAHEKMLKTTNHQGNANQNHNEISLHTCQDGYYKKLIITIIVEDTQKLEHLDTVGGESKTVQPIWKTASQCLRN